MITGVTGCTVMTERVIGDPPHVCEGHTALELGMEGTVHFFV